MTPLAGITDTFPHAEIIVSADDASIARNADLTIVIVGYTKRDEGEYLGAGMSDVISTLMPPVDHPTLGIADPEVRDQLANVLTPNADGGTGTAMGRGGDRDSLRLADEDERLIREACATSDRVCCRRHLRLRRGHALARSSGGDSSALVRRIGGRVRPW